MGKRKAQIQCANCRECFSTIVEARKTCISLFRDQTSCQRRKLFLLRDRFYLQCKGFVLLQTIGGTERTHQYSALGGAKRTCEDLKKEPASAARETCTSPVLRRIATFFAFGRFIVKCDKQMLATRLKSKASLQCWHHLRLTDRFWSSISKFGTCLVKRFGPTTPYTTYIHYTEERS